MYQTNLACWNCVQHFFEERSDSAMVILGLFAAFVGFEAISRSPCQIAWDGFVLGKQSATLVLTLKLDTA